MTNTSAFEKSVKVIAPPILAAILALSGKSPMSARVAAFILALFLLGSCSDWGSSESGASDNRSAGENEIIDFAAASLTESFTDIGAAFQQSRAGSQILFNFAGSQQLAHQISGGAPGHVFASANLVQMQEAIASNRVDATAPQPFAGNRLVVIIPADNPAQITTLQDLARPGVRLVLAAEQVPAGRYALDFLDSAATIAQFGPEYRSRVLANVASYELNVRAVLTKVALGEADAGIVYDSDVSGAQSSELGHIEIPDALNTIARYYIAPILDGDDETLARDFIDYVLSEEGQAILRRHGFKPLYE